MRVLSDSVAALLYCHKQIIHTVNAGVTWVLDSLDHSYNDIATPEKDYMWLVGTSGAIFRSTDNRTTWMQQPAPSTSDLFSIHALNTSVAWAVGATGTVLFTNDGGSTWDSLAVGTSQNLNSVCFSDENHGWIVGDGGVIVQFKRGVITSTEDSPSSPFSFTLIGNYPNPFNPSTTIAYRIPLRSRVRLRIFDQLGRVVSTLVDQEQSAGAYSVVWSSAAMSSGIYIVTLTTDYAVHSRKMVIVR